MPRTRCAAVLRWWAGGRRAMSEGRAAALHACPHSSVRCDRAARRRSASSTSCSRRQVASRGSCGSVGRGEGRGCGWGWVSIFHGDAGHKHAHNHVTRAQARLALVSGTGPPSPSPPSSIPSSRCHSCHATPARTRAHAASPASQWRVQELGGSWPGTHCVPGAGVLRSVMAARPEQASPASPGALTSKAHISRVEPGGRSSRSSSLSSDKKEWRAVCCMPLPSDVSARTPPGSLLTRRHDAPARPLVRAPSPHAQLPALTPVHPPRGPASPFASVAAPPQSQHTPSPSYPNT